MQETFDLGLAFVWEYDVDFIRLIELHLQSYGLTTYIIGEHNIEEVTQKVSSKKLAFTFYLDRAGDVDERFEKVGKMLQRRKTVFFNPYKNVLHAIDKATMHLEFMSAGVHVPYSIIIPPHSESERIYLSVSDLALLGRPFIIKPCNTTGGGLGVVTGAESLNEILRERAEFNEDKYILQEKIYPAYLDGKRAWFRSFYAFGKPIPTWWDDLTHLYSILTTDEISYYNLRKLYSITNTIARITGLDFFSTEIVYTKKGGFIAIDYVNDQCDMRIAPIHYDGVPEQVVNQIIQQLRKYITKIKRRKTV